MILKVILLISSRCLAVTCARGSASGMIAIKGHRRVERGKRGQCLAVTCPHGGIIAIKGHRRVKRRKREEEEEGEQRRKNKWTWRQRKGKEKGEQGDRRREDRRYLVHLGSWNAFFRCMDTC